MSDAEQEAAGCVIGRDYPAPIVDHKAERERAMERYRARVGLNGPASATLGARHGARALRPARPARRACRRCTSPASARCPTCRRRTTGTGAISSSTSGSRRARTAAASSTSRAARATAATCSPARAASRRRRRRQPGGLRARAAKYTRPGLRFERDMIETWTGDVDCVVFLQTIEHVQDPDAVLARHPRPDRAGRRRLRLHAERPHARARGGGALGQPVARARVQAGGVPRAVRAPLRAGRPARPVPRAQAAARTSSRSSTLGWDARPREAGPHAARSTTASRPRSPCATSRCAAAPLDRALDLLAVLRP